MISRGQTLENAVTGERFTFTDTAASTGGELLAFDFALRPGGAVPIPHVHPIQTERFEVTQGRMRFRVGLRKIDAGPGDIIEVAPGVAHSFANAGDDEAQLRVEVRPALAMENMFAEVVAMARAGRMNRRGMPRNLLDLADLARRYDREAHAPVLSVRVQRLLLAPLVLLARHRRAGRAAALIGAAGAVAAAGGLGRAEPNVGRRDALQYRRPARALLPVERRAPRARPDSRRHPITPTSPSPAPRIRWARSPSSRFGAASGDWCFWPAAASRRRRTPCARPAPT